MNYNLKKVSYFDRQRHEVEYDKESEYIFINISKILYNEYKKTIREGDSIYIEGIFSKILSIKDIMFKRIKDLFSTTPSVKDRKYRVVYFERKGTYAVQCNIKDELGYNKYLCSDNTYGGIKVSFDVLKTEFSSKSKAIKFLQSYLEQKDPIIVEQYIEEFTL